MVRIGALDMLRPSRQPSLPLFCHFFSPIQAARPHQGAFRCWPVYRQQAHLSPESRVFRAPATAEFIAASVSHHQPPIGLKTPADTWNFPLARLGLAADAENEYEARFLLSSPQYAPAQSSGTICIGQLGRDCDSRDRPPAGAIASFTPGTRDYKPCSRAALDKVRNVLMRASHSTHRIPHCLRSLNLIAPVPPSVYASHSFHPSASRNRLNAPEIDLVPASGHRENFVGPCNVLTVDSGDVVPPSEYAELALLVSSQKNENHDIERTVPRSPRTLKR